MHTAQPRGRGSVPQGTIGGIRAVFDQRATKRGACLARRLPADVSDVLDNVSPNQEPQEGKTSQHCEDDARESGAPGAQFEDALHDSGTRDGETEHEWNKKERCRGPGTPAVKTGDVDLDRDETGCRNPEQSG